MSFVRKCNKCFSIIEGSCFHDRMVVKKGNVTRDEEDTIADIHLCANCAMGALKYLLAQYTNSFEVLKAYGINSGL